MKYLTKTFTLPNGKRKYVRGKTKKELEEKVTALKRELMLGIDISDDSTVKDYADHWFKTYRSKDLTDGTRRYLEATMTNHIYPFIGKMRVREVKAAHIREIMQIGDSALISLGFGTLRTAVSAMYRCVPGCTNVALRKEVPLLPTG